MNALPGQFVEELRRAGDAYGARERFLERATSRPDSHLKLADPVHFTASGFVIDASSTFVALHFHKKIGALLQFGGHIEEGETSFEQAARREVLEESGLTEIDVVGDGPLVLHPHAMGENYTVCAEHWDVQYLFRTRFVPAHDHDGLTLSDESASVAWYRMDSLPTTVIEDVRETLAGPAAKAIHSIL